MLLVTGALVFLVAATFLSRAPWVCLALVAAATVHGAFWWNYVGVLVRKDVLDQLAALGSAGLEPQAPSR